MCEKLYPEDTLAFVKSETFRALFLNAFFMYHGATSGLATGLSALPV